MERDIVKRIEDLMDLFDEGEVTTADEIERPEDPFRDFNERNPKAGGGMLVQPSFGGVRQGYSGRKLTDLKNYGERGAKKITIYGKDYRLNTKGPNAGKVSFQTTKKGKDTTLYLTPKQLKDRLDTPRETGFVTGQQTKLAKKIDKNLNTWSKNWVKNNIKNYGVRDFKNFTKDMTNAWSKELKDNPNKYPSKFGVGTRLTNEFGLPVVRGGFQIEGITFPQRPDRPGFNPELTWQKLFINNKLKDKDFKAKVNSYLDWNLSKKVDGGAGAMTKTAALDYGKFTKGFDEDVVYLMGEILNNRALNPGGGQVGINDIFKNAFGKKGEAYFKKYQGSWGRWKNNFDAVAKLAGLDQSQANALLQKQINDSQNIMKLFNVKNLPPEFVVAQDHLFGLAEAKELGDPRIARQTLKALVATTKEQNRILGQGGFSQKRTALIKNFKKAPLEKKATIVNQLNTLADEYVPGRLRYNVRKDGSLKISNLKPESTFRERAISYRGLAKEFPTTIKKQFKIDKKQEAQFLRKMGFKCRFEGSKGGLGRCDDPASYTDDVNKTRQDLKSDDVRVRAAASAKLTRGLDVAKTLPTIGKFLRRVGQATVGGVSKALQATGIGTPVGIAIEGIVEGGIYDFFKGRGYTDQQALSETFFPGIVSGRPKGVPWYGGAEQLLEKELIGDPQQNPKVLQYQKALEDQEQVFDAFGRLDRGQQAGRKDITDTASADIQDLNRSGTISRINRIMNPESMASRAYQTAVERQQAGQEQRAKDYKDRFYVQREPSEFQQKKLQRERNEAMLQMFPPPIVGDVQDLYKAYGVEDRLKNFEAQDYKDVMSALDDFQKQNYFADNFRLEKARGGIAGLSGGDKSGPPPESGPNSQGLPSLLKRVKNL